MRTRNGRTVQLSLFESLMENPPLRQAIEFYKHEKGWSNRLIAGDSLLVMNSLLQKEGMAGQVQMVYIDPPYGIKYGSNFQPFIRSRPVKDGSDEDLTQEPETVKAFRDTWELGIHSYLTYLRDRITLSRQLLTESGSIFVQISEDNLHHIRELLDEVFGPKNFVAQFCYRTSAPLGSKRVPTIADYVVWYAKDLGHVKFRRLFEPKDPGDFDLLEDSDGNTRRLTDPERAGIIPLPKGSRPFQSITLVAAGPNPSTVFPVKYQGKNFNPTGGRGWKTTKTGMDRLCDAGRFDTSSDVLRYRFYLADFPFKELTNVWLNLGGAADKIYVVQTNSKVIQRCLLMATDPGDLVLDPTCGSGTTATTCEQWGRRWITCDTSRVAIALARQRLMTSSFDYYTLRHPEEGISSGLRYKVIPHITLKSVASDESPEVEVLYDQPEIDSSRIRVAGPFTVEAVPAPTVLSPTFGDAPTSKSDQGLAREGPTRTQADWRAELLKTGHPRKGRSETGLLPRRGVGRHSLAPCGCRNEGRGTSARRGILWLRLRPLGTAPS